MCAAVAVPVAVKAAGSAGPVDPIYAAIKAYQDGYAHHVACLAKADAIEEVFFTEWRKLDARLENSVATPEFGRLLSMIQTTQPSVTKEQLLEILRHKAREMIRDENGGDEMDRLREEGSAVECDARAARGQVARLGTCWRA